MNKCWNSDEYVKRNKRPCKRCDNNFTPDGKYQRICLDCLDKSMERIKKKMIINKLKRPCKLCSRSFLPIGKFCYYCEGCKKFSRDLSLIKIKIKRVEKYFKENLSQN